LFGLSKKLCDLNKFEMKNYENLCMIYLKKYYNVIILDVCQIILQ